MITPTPYIVYIVYTARLPHSAAGPCNAPSEQLCYYSKSPARSGSLAARCLAGEQAATAVRCRRHTRSIPIYGGYAVYGMLGQTADCKGHTCKSTYFNCYKGFRQSYIAASIKPRRESTRQHSKCKRANGHIGRSKRDRTFHLGAS